MANKQPQLSDSEKSTLLASARIAYTDPVGQDFWAELAERISIREGQSPEPQPPTPVEPLPRRE